MSEASETFQIPVEIAEMYEAKFVPRLFGEWASYLVEAAGVEPGHRVLDVACGTGAVTRVAADRAGGDGHVIGLDLNEAMLTVAGRVRPDIEWRQGDARDLPFPDRSFDAVLCQSGLMFFPEVAPALREMARVVTEAGTVGIQTWDRLEAQPAYLPFARVVGKHAGREAIGLVTTYFMFGDLDQITAILRDAGLEVTRTRTRTSTMHFGSVGEFVGVEVGSTPLAERLTQEAYANIVADSREALRLFTAENGELAIPISGHLVTARPR